MDTDLGPGEPGPGAAAEGESPPPKRVVPEGARKGRGRWLRAALALLVLFCAIQGAGVLLRDRVEGRRPILAKPPEAPAAPETALPAGTVPPSSRFGPDVREVDVGAPPAPPAVPGPAGSGTPLPGPGTGPAPVSPGKDRVLDLGLHYSQHYLKETEAKLAGLGLPHFRVESERQGRGFRLAVSAPGEAERQRVRAALEKGGYLFREVGGELQAYFLTAAEARAAAAEISAGGIRARVLRVKGRRPTWSVYAGPFSREEAAQALERVRALGLDAVIAERPRTAP